MINRRILRIKALQVLYSHFKKEGQSLQNAEKELFHSIQRSYDLYHHLFWLVVEIKKFAEERIELNRNKKIPSQGDLNPITKFVDNKVINQISDNEGLLSFLEQKKFSWVNSPELIKKVFAEVEISDLYSKYIESDKNTYAEDKAFVSRLFTEIIVNIEDIYDVLEEQSIYWNDEIEYVLSMIGKSVKKFEESKLNTNKIVAEFEDEDDTKFIKTLLRKTILNHKENLDLIEENTKNWEIDRIAYMDTIILEMSLTELVEFPQIPIKVSFNEYLELSKIYSTQKSSTFINGILDKMAKKLLEEGTIKKMGRGLIEN